MGLDFVGQGAAETDGNIITTTIDKVVNWGRKNSLWPMPFGTACCAIEMMATLASKFDLSRFGSEAIRFSTAPIRSVDRFRQNLHQNDACPETYL